MYCNIQVYILYVMAIADMPENKQKKTKNTHKK